MAVLINLLPDIKQQRLRAKRRKRNMLLAAMGIMGVGIALPLISGIAIGTQRLLIEREGTRNQQGIEELKSVENINEALTAQNQLRSIYSLKDNGEDYRGFFTILESAISPNVSIQSIAIDASGVMEISGTAKDVDAVNVVVQSFSSFTPSGLNLDKFDEERQTFFSDVRVVSIQPPENEDLATFVFEANFNFALLDIVSDDLNRLNENENSPFNGDDQ